MLKIASYKQIFTLIIIFILTGIIYIGWQLSKEKKIVTEQSSEAESAFQLPLENNADQVSPLKNSDESDANQKLKTEISPESEQIIKDTEMVVDPSQVVLVKFHEETDIRLRNSRLVSVSGTFDLTEFYEVIANYSIQEIKRGVWQIPEQELTEMKRQSEAKGLKTYDLNLFFNIIPTEETDLKSLVRDLQSLSIVQTASIQGRPVAPVSESFTSRQGYLEAADGIDAAYAQTIPGGQGSGVKIIDLEHDWNLNHEDLTKTRNALLGGTRSGRLTDRNHGAAVLGVLVGDENDFGITGIVSDADIGVFGVQTQLDIPGSILLAAQELRPGDVLLLELQIPGPESTGVCDETDDDGCVLVEWNLAVYSAIYDTVNNKKIIVIEAAGNGGNDLDDDIYLSQFDRSRDSGAIIVGAGNRNRTRFARSNYGERVDLQGWGEDVVTTGYGDLFPGNCDSFDANPDNDCDPAFEDEFYTETFAGTSSASAIVAGAAASVQGVAIQRFGMPLSPSQIRQLLVEMGNPQPEPGKTNEPIGPLPNLRQAISQIMNTLTNVSFQPLLQGRNVTDEIFTITILALGTQTIVDEFSTQSDPTSGTFALPLTVLVDPGIYDLLVHSPGYLRKKVFDVEFVSNTTITLPELLSGDLNDDNIINSLDWSRMNSNWFTSDPVSDINRDGLVNSIDFGWMNRNWGRSGD